MFPSEEETCFWIALNLAQQTVYQSVDCALKAKDLPPLRWYDVLWALERAETHGARPYEMEKSLLFEQSNLSRLLRRIVDDGLAVESVLEKDRRGKVFRITTKGIQVRKNMWKIYGPLIHAHVASLRPQVDLDQMTQALTPLIDKG